MRFREVSLDIAEVTQKTHQNAFIKKNQPKAFIYCLVVYQLILVRHTYIQAGKQNLVLECDQRVSLLSSGSCSTNSSGINGMDQEYHPIREEEGSVWGCLFYSL